MNKRQLAGVAQSNYRQVRVTVTQEINGNLSYRVYAKRLQDGWQERHCIASGAVHYDAPIQSIEDALSAAIFAIQDQMLPGIG